MLALFLVSCGDGNRVASVPPIYTYQPVQQVTEPELVTLSDTEAVFTWVTDSLSDTHVFLGEDEPGRHYDLSGPPTRNHHASIQGLEPGTTYHYRLQSGGRATPVTDRSPGRFTTLETPPGQYLFSFATINDTHFGEETAGLICVGGTCLNEGFQSPWPDDPHWAFTNSAVVQAINRKMPDFVIHKGDVSSEYLEEEFVAAKEVFDTLRMPYYILRGNHDRVGDPGYYITHYSDIMKDTNFLAYVNFLRRVRKLSGTDSQDQAAGQDLAFDDADGLQQMIRPDRYPYEIRVIDEREFLVPAYTFDVSDYLDSKEKFKWKGLKFERRPMWVVEMKQLDPNYLYSKRVIYFDKETLLPHLWEYYDQKGRYYRTFEELWGIVAPMGYYNAVHVNNCDWIDTHCTWTFSPAYPALWLSRKEMSLRSMMRQK